MKQRFQRMTPSNIAFLITVPESTCFTHCGLHDIIKFRLPLHFYFKTKSPTVYIDTFQDQCH